MIEKKWHSRGYLPHVEQENCLQFVTFHTSDSLPQDALRDIEVKLVMLKNSLSISCHSDLLKHKINEFKVRSIEKILDSGKGNCPLRNPDLANIVKNAINFFDEERYELHSWCIMPTHVHVMVKTQDGFKLSEIFHSWKSFSSKEINKKINGSGSFWNREYYDTFIRDEKHYNSVLDYITMNPVKAGLVGSPEKWRWSSLYRGE